MTKAIFWFRNDLRVEDNEGLVKAARENEEILPVYILERSWLKEKQFGIDRMGPFRLKFLLESLQNLKDKLKTLGSDLLIAIGEPVTDLQLIAEQHDCQKIYAQAASAYDEIKTETLLAKHIPCDFIWGETLYPQEDLDCSVNDIPEVFTHFRKTVEQESLVRKCYEAPLQLLSPVDFGSKVPDLASLGYETPQLDKRSALHFIGGASKAMERVEYYLWNKELLSTYKNTRNGLIGGDYSSKLSGWPMALFLQDKYTGP